LGFLPAFGNHIKLSQPMYQIFKTLVGNHLLQFIRNVCIRNGQ